MRSGCLCLHVVLHGGCVTGRILGGFGSRWWLLMLFLCKVDHDEQFSVAVCVCVKNVCVFGAISCSTFLLFLGLKIASH